MTPIGKELDAAVLRILGFNPSHNICGNLVYVKRGQLFKLGVDDLSADSNGHEALRLCGPWLDGHTWRWSMETDASGTSVMFWERTGAFPATLPLVATRAEAICRLVLAIHERNTNPPRAT